MTNFSEWHWLVDTKEMVCRNAEYNTTIKIRKEGGNLRGTLSDMPMDLFAEIARHGNGEKIIAAILKTAEEEYKRICAD
jgi:hypothetical protein